MLCKTCKRAVIRVYEGEKESAYTEHGEHTETIDCPVDNSHASEMEKIIGKLIACSKYLPKDKEAKV